MKNRVIMWRGERGIVLITSVLTLIVLSILGAAAISLSRLEVDTAGNDRAHKETMYVTEFALTEGEFVAETLQGIQHFNPEGIAAHYSKIDAAKLAWSDPVLWEDDALSQKILVSYLPDAMQQLVDGDSLPRYTVQVKHFKTDSLGSGQEIPRGKYFFEVTARGSKKGAHAPVSMLQTVYAQRYN